MMVEFRCFLLRPIKKQNEKKTRWEEFNREITKMSMCKHMGFVRSCCCFLFLFLFFCVFMFLFLFLFRRFLFGHDFYFLINLGDCFFLFCHFLILIGHHFLTKVYE